MISYTAAAIIAFIAFAVGFVLCAIMGGNRDD